jgi:hypothetical protein
MRVCVRGLVPVLVSNRRHALVPQWTSPYPPLTAGELIDAADNQGHKSPPNDDGLWSAITPPARGGRLQLRAQPGHDIGGADPRFYGRDANHQYFDGFSDGGHQAFDVGSQDYRLVDAVAAPDDPALSTARV